MVREHNGRKGARKVTRASGLGSEGMQVIPSPGQASAADRIELLLDSLADYAIYMLDPNGFVITWNSGAERIKGYQAVEILGQHFSKFFSASDRAARLPQKMLDMARTSGRTEAEGWRLRRDGSR